MSSAVLSKLWAVNSNPRHFKILFRALVNAEMIVNSQCKKALKDMTRNSRTQEASDDDISQHKIFLIPNGLPSLGFSDLTLDDDEVVDLNSVTEDSFNEDPYHMKDVNCQDFHLFRRKMINFIRSSLLSALNEGIVNSSNENFFYFTGENSGLLLPRFKRLTPKGFSIHLWFNINSESKILNHSNYMVLFHLCCPNDDYFSLRYNSMSKFLEIEFKSKGHCSTIVLSNSLISSDDWQSISLSYCQTKRSWTSGQTPSLTVFVNGLFSQSSSPEFLNDGCYSSLFFGCSPLQIDHNNFPDIECVEVFENLDYLNIENCFNGKMSTIYMFDGPVSEKHAKAFYNLGPMYSDLFKSINDDSILYSQDFVRDSIFFDLKNKEKQYQYGSDKNSININKDLRLYGDLNFLFETRTDLKILLCLKPQSLINSSPILSDSSSMGLSQSLMIHTLKDEGIDLKSKIKINKLKNSKLLLILSLEICYVRKVYSFKKSSVCESLSQISGPSIFSYFPIFFSMPDLSASFEVDNKIQLYLEKNIKHSSYIFNKGIITGLLRLHANESLIKLISTSKELNCNALGSVLDNESNNLSLSCRTSIFSILNVLRDYYSYDYSNIYPLVRSSIEIPPHSDPSVYMWTNWKLNSEITTQAFSKGAMSNIFLSSNEKNEIRKVYLDSLLFLLSKAESSKNSGNPILSNYEAKKYVDHLVYMCNRDSLHVSELLNALFICISDNSELSKSIATKLCKFGLVNSLCYLIQFDDDFLCSKAVEMVVLLHNMSLEASNVSSTSMYTFNLIGNRNITFVSKANLDYVFTLLKSKQKLTMNIYLALISVAIGIGDQMSFLAISNINFDLQDDNYQRENLENTQVGGIAISLPHKTISNVDAIIIILELLALPNTSDRIKSLVLNDLLEIFLNNKENFSKITSASNSYLYNLFILSTAPSDCISVPIYDIGDLSDGDQPDLFPGSFKDKFHVSSTSERTECKSEQDLTFSFDSKVKMIKTAYLLKDRSGIENNQDSPSFPSDFSNLQETSGLSVTSSINNKSEEPGYGNPSLFKDSSAQYPLQAFKLLVSLLWQSIKSIENSLDQLKNSISIIWIVSPLRGSEIMFKLFYNLVELTQAVIYEIQVYKDENDRFLASKEEQRILVSNLDEFLKLVESWLISGLSFQKLISQNKNSLIYHKNSSFDPSILKSKSSSTFSPWDTNYEFCKQYQDLLFSLTDLNQFESFNIKRSDICSRILWTLISGLKSTRENIIIDTLKSLIRLLQTHPLQIFIERNTGSTNVETSSGSICKDNECPVVQNYLPLLGQLHQTYLLFNSHSGNQTSSKSDDNKSEPLPGFSQEIFLLYAIILQQYLPILVDNNRYIFSASLPTFSSILGKSLPNEPSLSNSVGVMNFIKSSYWINVCKDNLTPEILKFDEDEISFRESFIISSLNKIREMLTIKFDYDFKEEKNSKYTESMVSNSIKNSLSSESDCICEIVSFKVAISYSVPPIFIFLHNYNLFVTFNSLSLAITRAVDAIDQVLPNRPLQNSSKSKSNLSRNISTKLSKSYQSLVQKVLSLKLKEYLVNMKIHLKAVKHLTSPRQTFSKDIYAWWDSNDVNLDFEWQSIGTINLLDVSDSNYKGWSVDYVQDKSRMLQRLVPIKSKDFYRPASSKKTNRSSNENQLSDEESSLSFTLHNQSKPYEYDLEKNYVKRFLNFKKKNISVGFYIVPSPKDSIFRLKCSKVMLLHEVYGYLDVANDLIFWTVIHNNLGYPLLEYDTNPTSTYSRRGSQDKLNSKLLMPQAILSQLDLDFSYQISDIIEIQIRTICYKPSGIELFFKNRTSVLFHISKKNELESFYDLILKLNPLLKKIPFSEASCPQKMLEISQITYRWKIGQLTNFDYLMALNTLSGRSYNDLSQYPIFPWILKDYTSSKLDLNSPKIYRDLSKPIGALNDERLSKFRERCNSFEDPSGKIPKFLYGTHYSSPASLSHFLIRNEPYTSIHILLQNGKFDFADRQFYSINEAWNSCINSSWDVKELIPEFFYQPDFLLNHMALDLGSKQDGKKLGDVELPPWAESSPAKFIELHRKALESEYVSSNLHHWIDLIFGYKQKGEEAKKSDNLFYYLTYPNVAMMDSIIDETEKKSMELQMKYFGQTPNQLFLTPHPKRDPITPQFRPICDQLLHSEYFVLNLQTDSCPELLPEVSKFSCPIIHTQPIDIYSMVPCFDINLKSIVNSESNSVTNEFSEFVFTIDANGRFRIHKIEILTKLNMDIDSLDSKATDSIRTLENISKVDLILTPILSSLLLSHSIDENCAVANSLESIKYCTSFCKPNLVACTNTDETTIIKIPFDDLFFGNGNTDVEKSNLNPISGHIVLPCSGILKSSINSDLTINHPIIRNNNSTLCMSSEISTRPQSSSSPSHNLSPISSFSEDDFVNITSKYFNLSFSKTMPCNTNIRNSEQIPSLAENTAFSILKSHLSNYSESIYQNLNINDSKKKKIGARKESSITKSIFGTLSDLGASSNFSIRDKSSLIGLGFGSKNLSLSSPSILSKKSYSEWKITSSIYHDSCFGLNSSEESVKFAKSYQAEPPSINDSKIFSHLVNNVSKNEDVDVSPLNHSNKLHNLTDNLSISLNPPLNKNQSCISFSNCGTLLSVGCEDGSIFIYSISKTYSPMQKFSTLGDKITKNLQQSVYGSYNESINEGQNFHKNNSSEPVSYVQDLMHEKIYTNDLTKILNDGVEIGRSNNLTNQYQSKIADNKIYSKPITKQDSKKDGPNIEKLQYSQISRLIGHTISHDGSVKNICLDTNLDLMVSCSLDNTIVIHSLSKMKVIRTLRPNFNIETLKYENRENLYFNKSIGSDETKDLDSFNRNATTKSSDQKFAHKNSWNSNISVPLFSEFFGSEIFKSSGIIEKLIILPDSKILIFCYIYESCKPGEINHENVNQDRSRRSYFLQTFSVNGQLLHTSGKLGKGISLVDWSTTGHYQSRKKNCDFDSQIIRKKHHRVFGKSNAENSKKGVSSRNSVKKYSTSANISTKRSLLALLNSDKTVFILDLNNLRTVGIFSLPLNGFCINFGTTSSVQDNRASNSTIVSFESKPNSKFLTKDLLYIGCGQSQLIVMRL
ncbi:Neurobeachin-like protein 2 [Smittium mucronatum]|uniref:Beige protein homolog 1 n=1 Tax=Smittium mucronatum TaxID=133383 RepID=A0A1R0GLJ8_9FUNG|nr:Neurobeachin-like protein 2 [Smittium mucronatum]